MCAARLIVVLLVLVSACSEDEQNTKCVPVDEALAAITSLSNIKEKGIVAGRPSCIVYAHAQIFACQYKGETTYYFTNLASSNSMCGSIAYDCHGEEILNRGSDEAGWTAFDGERTEVVELWKKP